VLGLLNPLSRPGEQHAWIQAALLTVRLSKFWRIADDPARCGIAVELKADAASVLTGVIHAPSDLGKKATTVLSLKPYSLRAAEITAQKQAAAIFRNVLRQDLIDKRRPILIPASYR